MDNPFLLSDGEVAEFIVKGYHLVEPELPLVSAPHSAHFAEKFQIGH